MTETYSKSKNSLNGRKSRINNLANKVVLLIGNDAALLHSLAVACAANGSDVVLASSRLSGDTAGTIEESVHILGGRFLFLDRDLYQNRKAETIVNQVKKEMGGMDILIDVSARNSDHRPLEEIKRDNSQPKLWLSKAIFQEIGS